MTSNSVEKTKRLLAVALEHDELHLSRVMKDLTGSAPQPVAATVAGMTHDLHLNTPYYSATVPVWLDIVSNPLEWSASFLSVEAKEVLSVLGGLLLVFSLPLSSSGLQADQTAKLIKEVGAVLKQGLGGWEWDGVGLAVGLGNTDDAEEWDEMCAETGLEFVHVKGGETGRNEFGEKMGIERVKEALESNDWELFDASGPFDFSDFEDDETSLAKKDDAQGSEQLDFGYDPADFEGMKSAIWGLNRESSPDQDQGEGSAGLNLHSEDTALGDDEVMKVETMMRKLQSVKEASEGLSEEQRKRMAARAVSEVMKEL